MKAYQIIGRAPIDDDTAAKLIRMLERRFGESFLPYWIERTSAEPLTWEITDRESGSWVIAARGKGRLHCIAEHDCMAAVAATIVKKPA